jgi:phosphoribosylamine-glycine ligase
VKNCQAIYFPDKVSQWVKLKKSVIIDKVTSIVPMLYGSSDIGAIVGIGDTLQEAIDSVISTADEIEGNGIVIRQDALDDAEKELKAFQAIK